MPNIQRELLATEESVADTASTIISASEEAELLAEEAKEAEKEDEAKAEPSPEAAELMTTPATPIPSGETAVNEEDERAAEANSRAVSRHAFITKQRNALKAKLGRAV